jgi:hypothetical protein
MRTVTDVLRDAIRASGEPLLALERQAGVHRASISRFLRRERWLRSDAVDKLAAHLGLTLVPTRGHTGKKGDRT